MEGVDLRSIMKIVPMSYIFSLTSLVFFIRQIFLLQAETLPSSRQSFKLDSAVENVAARQNDIHMIAEQTHNAMDEFVILSEAHGPVWQPVPGGSFEIPNRIAYAAKFGADNSANIIGFKTEATPADVVVMMGAKYIMDYLMDSVSCIHILKILLFILNQKNFII
jgi:hypothetical protein